MTTDTINLFGLSGGKDSSRLWAWAFNESGYPAETIRGSFADTENEYQEVYDQIRFLSDYGVQRGAPPIRILRSEGFLNLCIRKKRFPSARARFCTQILKMYPTLYYVQELQLAGYNVISHSGVRRAESIERSLLPAEDFNTFLQCVVRRPMLDMTIKEVWEGHKRYGIPVNPLYFTGRKRVGCRLCCMSNKQDVRITAKTRPWVIDTYREWEKVVGADNQAPSLQQKKNEHGSGFFRATTVPDYLRSVKGLVRKRNSKRGKKGDTYSACTIDDVVKWSTTLRGGRQLGMEFLFEMDDTPIYAIDDAHLPCQSGYCE